MFKKKEPSSSGGLNLSNRGNYKQKFDLVSKVRDATLQTY